MDTSRRSNASRDSIIKDQVGQLNIELEKRGISPTDPLVAQSIIDALAKVGLIGRDDLLRALDGIQARGEALLDDATHARINPNSALFLPQEWLNKN